MFNSREIRIVAVTGAAALAAVALGVVAIRLSRYETAVRKAEARERLTEAAALLADRCTAKLSAFSETLEREAAVLPCSPLDRLAAFAAGHPAVSGFFIADGRGELQFPAPGGAWEEKHAVLFRDRLAPNDTTQYALVVMPRALADRYRREVRPARDDRKKIHPQQADMPAIDKKERSKKSAERKKKLRLIQFLNITPEPAKVRSSDVCSESAPTPAPASAPAEMLADTLPKATPEPQLKPTVSAIAISHSRSDRDGEATEDRFGKRTSLEVTRFQLLTREHESGYLPYLVSGRFSPLIWARNRTNGTERIVGFQLNSAALLNELRTLFGPSAAPAWGKFVLYDISGAPLLTAGTPKTGRAETVSVVPFAPEYLPEMRLEAEFYPALFPDASERSILFGVAALLGTVVSAGGVMLHLVRRELRAARTKSSFVSQVSHELKTPLTGIRMYTELLREHPELSEEKRRRYLDTVTEECSRLNRMVENVLDFSRMAEKRKLYHSEKLNLVPLLHDTAERCRELLKNTGMELETSLPESPFETVFDRDAFHAILENLISNAMKYGSSGGRIALSFDREHGELHVRDFGPGVPEPLREKIFERFFRADDALDSANGGFGLGLAIARGMARDLGGELDCRAAAPGADFVLTFPHHAQEDS